MWYQNWRKASCTQKEEFYFKQHFSPFRTTNTGHSWAFYDILIFNFLDSTVKLGNKERFDKEQIGIKEPFPVTNLPFTS